MTHVSSKPTICIPYKSLWGNAHSKGLVNIFHDEPFEVFPTA